MASAGQGKTRGQASILKCDAYINQSIIAIVGKLELLDTTFLFYNVMLRYEELRVRSDASSTRGSITTDMLKKLPIYCLIWQLKSILQISFPRMMT